MTDGQKGQMTNGRRKDGTIQATKRPRRATSLDPERRTARNWYWWLWLSPLLTIPTLLALYFSDPGYKWICGRDYRGCDWTAAERVTVLIAVLGSALWHLVLLIPALNKERPFVRWHGRQALLLAGVQTAVVLALGSASTASVVVLFGIWLGGTLWGQRQAARGDCSLMRWLGRGEALPPPEPAVEPALMAERETEALVDVIRHSSDPQERRQALAELEKRGMVDTM